MKFFGYFLTFAFEPPQDLVRKQLEITKVMLKKYEGSRKSF
jgi:hypothetical protein